MGIGNRERSRGALGGIGEVRVRKKLFTAPNHRLAFTGGGIELQERGVKFGTAGGIGKLGVKKRDELCRTRAVKIRDGATFFFGEFARGGRRVQKQGKDAV